MRWLKDHPRLLEHAYRRTEAAMRGLSPLFARIGYRRLQPAFVVGEQIVKGAIWNCQMCGQCVLHSTGMTCPMTCPKNLRNGPCGGVRLNGHCEVKPEMDCVWVQAYERSRRMARYGDEIRQIQPPVNRALQGTAAWLNMLTGVDKETPRGWPPDGPHS
jgi:hypothetical protein